LRTVSRTIALAALFICAGAPAYAAHAAGYPERPIRLIIGSAAGSGPDIMARLVADHLHGAWGQRVVVDARPGVAGIISAEQTLRGNPDGYTWMMLTSQLFIATAVYPNLKFNLDAVYPAALPHVSSNRLRALGVSTPKRAPGLPDVAAIADSVPGFVTFGWYSIVAPKGTPDAVMTKASAEIVRAARQPAFGERIKTLGIEIIGGGRQELDAFRAAERKRLSELVKATGISVQ
jgi:tripartite-type tricarboxylate transporter receptor subunit TctC